MAQPVLHLARAVLRERAAPEVLPPGFVDDASRLDRARVAEVFRVAADPAVAEAQLAADQSAPAWTLSTSRASSSCIPRSPSMSRTIPPSRIAWPPML